MSFDIPIHIPDNSHEARVIEAIMSQEHVSPEEIVRRAIRSLAVPQTASAPKAAKRPGKGHDLLTDELVNQLKALDTSYGLLEDVPDEKIKRMEATIRRMKREGFPSRS